MNSDSRRLKAFLLTVVVWLPLAFIGWAVLATWLDALPVWLSGKLLTGLWPDIFRGVEVAAGDVNVVTALMVPQGDRVGQLLFAVDPMMYGYGLPLYVALAMATPLTIARRFGQCVVVALAVWLVQVAGLVTAALRLVAFSAGPVGQVAAARAGLAPDAVALAYQLCYLMLPAVLPAVLWVLMNRRFIEPLGEDRAEPAAAGDGQ